MELLKLVLLLKISTIALYGSWVLTQESHCQSEKHSLKLKKLTKAILSNSSQVLYKCSSLEKIKVSNQKVLFSTNIKLTL